MIADDLRMAIDPAFWFESYSGIELDQWQKELLTSQKDTIVNVSRQGGKSFTCGILAVHYAAYHPGSLVLLVSYNLDQSLEIGAKCRAVCNTCRVATTSEAVTHIYFANGSRILALCGQEQSIRGYSANLIIIDEASRVPDELIFAVRPMLSVTRGRLALISTPWIKSGYFYDTWISDDPGWLKIKVTADQIPRITPEFLASERKSMPDAIYKREYFCQFMQLGEGCLFSDEDIDAMFSSEVKELQIDF